MEKELIIKGTITITSLGSGYVASDLFEEDVFIPFQFLNTALNGDQVEIILLPAVPNERQRGEVVSIIKRKKEEFVGTIERKKKDKFSFLIADDPKMYVDIFIPNTPRGVKNNIKCLVRIIEWKDSKKNPVGEIVKVIGRKGDNDVEMESIVIEKGFEISFPENVEEEADQIKKMHSEEMEKGFRKRRDVRGSLTITIDPADAKDFDDAISYKKVSDDLHEVGIHIADVAHWVKEKSSIDKEARKRGFSIYLPDRTIPMLPEVLSNDVCSLNPNEDKLTFSVIVKMSSEGKVKDTWIGKTVMNSDKKFSYEEAQESIDQKKGEYFNELTELLKITQKLRKKRIENGSLEIGQEELKMELDNSGVPLKIYTKKGIPTQNLIEELMVLANNQVANVLSNKSKGRVCIYRVHDKPDRDALDNLFSFLKKLGHNLKIQGSTATSKDLNGLLADIKDTDEEFLAKSVLVRSLPKAIYSIDNKGHFALAIDSYAHFTSPIRRYADLLVHRSMMKKIDGKPSTRSETVFYKETAESLSQIELDILSTERESIAFKQVQYMLERIGKSRKGIISGVTDWGIYVQDIETRSEGMVRLKEMKNDFYVFDKENFAIVGSRTKKRYALGDKVSFKVKGGELDQKRLDYVFAK